MAVRACSPGFYGIRGCLTTRWSRPGQPEDTFSAILALGWPGGSSRGRWAAASPEPPSQGKGNVRTLALRARLLCNWRRLRSGHSQERCSLHFMMKEVLDEGAALVRQGKIAEAKEKFQWVLRHDHDNTLAWLWMTKCVSTDAERLYIFRHVNLIDPGNIRAIEGIQLYGGAPHEQSRPPIPPHPQPAAPPASPSLPQAGSYPYQVPVAPSSPQPSPAPNYRPTNPPPHPPRSNSGTTRCKSCHNTVAKSAPSCPHCGEVAPALRIRCPRCASMSFSAGKRGFALGGAALGAVLLGPVGLLGGLVGSKDVELTCSQCHHRWRPRPEQLAT